MLSLGHAAGGGLGPMRRLLVLRFTGTPLATGSALAGEGCGYHPQRDLKAQIRASCSYHAECLFRRLDACRCH